MEAVTKKVTRGVRGDIQGLRAIAVLTVLAAHAGLPHLAGGYVGVDVFFVISGFLITQQLVREGERDGRVSLVSFYARRARRILPAATVVLLATVAYAAARLGVLATRSITTDALWASAFAANIHFAREGTDYFQQGQPPSPLQHFWSLAVEEQFYLVWPLLVLVCAWLVHRRRADGARGLGRVVLAVLGVVILGSLAWSIYSTHHSAASAYFSTPARAWELAIGAVCAVVVTRDGFRLPVWASQVLGVLGLLLIAYACLAFGADTPFPGSAALVPVIGSAALLVAGTHAEDRRTNLAGALIARRPLRLVGDWSYSLYLWHFPLLVLPELAAGHALSWQLRLGLALAAVAISALSYRFVENPFRRARTWRVPWRAVVLYPLSVALVIGCISCARPYADHVLQARGQHAAITARGVPADATPGSLSGKQLHRLVRSSVRAALHDRAVPTTLDPALEELESSNADLGDCDYFETDSRELCARGDADATKTVVLLGNSHGRHWTPALDEIAATAHVKLYYLVMSQCTMSLVTQDAMNSTEPFTKCADFHEWALSTIRALHPDEVIVSSNPIGSAIHTSDGERVTDPTRMRELESAGYVDLFRRLRPLTKRAVLLRDIPQVTAYPGSCLATHDHLRACLSHRYEWQKEEADLQADAARTAHADVVSMDDFFCQKGWCPVVVGDVITHRDRSHMTTEYSAMLAQPLGHRLGLL